MVALISPISSTIYCRPSSHSFQLSDDIQWHILSFVATAPYENLQQQHREEDASGMVTSSIAKVSKSFFNFTRSSILWELALRRAVLNNVLWRSAAEITQPEWERSSRQVDYKELYQHVVQEHLRFTGPVFVMGFQDSSNIPGDFDIYLYERRYRIMMSRLLKLEHLETAREALAAIQSPVYFLHAYQGLCGKRPPALLVEVRRCWMHRDGSYSVSLHVAARTYLEKIWPTADPSNLYHATAVRTRNMPSPEWIGGSV